MTTENIFLNIQLLSEMIATLQIAAQTDNTEVTAMCENKYNELKERLS